MAGCKGGDLYHDQFLGVGGGRVGTEEAGRHALCGRMNENKFSLLVFASVPPPEHGQSRMVATMLDALEGGLEVEHVDARFSEVMDDLGRGLIGKTALMLGFLWEALVANWRGRARTLYFVPGPVTWSAVLKDWLGMAILRVWYRDVIFHWHAIGHGEWAHGSERCRLPGPGWLDRVARKVSAVLLNQPELSIVVSPTSDTDARALGSKRIEVVCNGIEDPCPEYGEKVLPGRKRRAQEIQESEGQEIRILFMAHGALEKGLMDAVFALELALGRLKGGQRILMTFAGGVAENREEEFVAGLERIRAIADCSVEFKRLGFVSGEEKARCFEEADLFIAASRWESFGLTVLESMAWGVPVVGVASDGVKGVLPEGYDWLVPVGDQEGLGGALEMGIRTLREGEGAARGGQLRERYVEYFQKERFESEIRSVMEQHCPYLSEGH